MFGNVYQGKNVLITGHTGFKGSWLAVWLKKLGAKVTGLSEYIPSNPSHFEILKNAEPNLIGDNRGDIRNIETLIEVIEKTKPDIIFHLAARAIVKDCLDNPKTAFDVNIGGTVNLIEAIRRKPGNLQALVLITSDKCYENVEWVYGYRETDQLGGKDPYSASKACAEIAYHSYFETYLKHTNIFSATGRAGNVIGGGDWADKRIIPDAARAWSTDSVLKIRSPNSTRPWQHVLEPLSGYLCLGQKLINKDSKVNGESFNFGPSDGTNKTVLETIEAMGQYWPGKNWKVEGESFTAKEAHLLKLCCDKALNYLSWQATLDFEQTINFTANWYKTYYQSPQDTKNILALTENQINEYCEFAKLNQIKWAIE